ncbi:MAG: PaaI family thioesterase [Burkholderiales bacterium]
MSIWHDVDPKHFAAHPPPGTLAHHLGIEFTELGPDFLRGRMPVDGRTRQNYGILHGGASVSLAETLMSHAASMTVDRALYSCVGLEINANHIRSVRDGWVEGVARPLHRGRSTQVWQCEIRDPNARVTCLSRMTISVITRIPTAM